MTNEAKWREGLDLALRENYFREPPRDIRIAFEDGYKAAREKAQGEVDAVERQLRIYEDVLSNANKREDTLKEENAKMTACAEKERLDKEGLKEENAKLNEKCTLRLQRLEELEEENAKLRKDNEALMLDSIKMADLVCGSEPSGVVQKLTARVKELEEVYFLMRYALSEIGIAHEATVSDPIEGLTEYIVSGNKVVAQCRKRLGDKRSFEELEDATKPEGE